MASSLPIDQAFSLNILAKDLKDQQLYDSSSAVMKKCTQACFISLKESEMLPSEEKCTYNCVIKSLAMQKYMDQSLQYALRNL